MSDIRPQGEPDEAMLDLLVKQVTEGLSPAEQRALDVMDSELASAYSRELERAAAAVTLAGSSSAAPLPAALSARLAQQAAEHFASPGNVADLSAERARAAAEQVRAQRPAPGRTNRFGGYGWLAAAACLVLAIFGWQRSPSPPIAAIPTPVVVTRPIAPPSLEALPAPPPPTLTEERDALLAKDGALKISLGATKDPAAAGVTGDAVWDPVTQRGFLHFAGLAPNDPAVHQYQIWIFDAGRDKRYPVDGGVFDVPANGGEVIIPIRAALMVRKPAAFAVTVEKPGGVVVSGREHVVVLGATS
jgi:Anti-sigma-K factor rskA